MEKETERERETARVRKREEEVSARLLSAENLDKLHVYQGQTQPSRLATANHMPPLSLYLFLTQSQSCCLSFHKLISVKSYGGISGR